jgi:uncharacterized protein
MIIDIRTIPPGHSTLSQNTGLVNFKAELPPFAGEIHCRAEIDRNESVLYVHLTFEGVFILECARCLESFNWPLAGETRLVIRERPSGDAGDDAADFFYDSRHLAVDVGPVVYEEICTSLPLKPLCTSECKGIEIKTDIPATAETDPRWDALRKLKNNSIDTIRR